jgi:hypothetical protein
MKCLSGESLIGDAEDPQKRCWDGFRKPIMSRFELARADASMAGWPAQRVI